MSRRYQVEYRSVYCNGCWVPLVGGRYWFLYSATRAVGKRVVSLRWVTDWRVVDRKHDRPILTVSRTL